MIYIETQWTRKMKKKRIFYFFFGFTSSMGAGLVNRISFWYSTKGFLW